MACAGRPSAGRHVPRVGTGDATPAPVHADPARAASLPDVPQRGQRDVRRGRRTRSACRPARSSSPKASSSRHRPDDRRQRSTRDDGGRRTGLARVHDRRRVVGVDGELHGRERQRQHRSTAATSSSTSNSGLLLQAMRVTGGVANRGAGILNNGTVVIALSLLDDNNAQIIGGAIANVGTSGLARPGSGHQLDPGRQLRRHRGRDRLLRPRATTRSSSPGHGGAQSQRSVLVPARAGTSVERLDHRAQRRQRCLRSVSDGQAFSSGSWNVDTGCVVRPDRVDQPPEHAIR